MAKKTTNEGVELQTRATGEEGPLVALLRKELGDDYPWERLTKETRRAYRQAAEAVAKAAIAEDRKGAGDREQELVRALRYYADANYYSDGRPLDFRDGCITDDRGALAEDVLRRHGYEIPPSDEILRVALKERDDALAREKETYAILKEAFGGDEAYRREGVHWPVPITELARAVAKELAKARGTSEP